MSTSIPPPGPPEHDPSAIAPVSHLPSAEPALPPSVPKRRTPRALAIAALVVAIVALAGDAVLLVDRAGLSGELSSTREALAASQEREMERSRRANDLAVRIGDLGRTMDELEGENRDLNRSLSACRVLWRRLIRIAVRGGEPSFRDALKLEGKLLDCLGGEPEFL